MERLPRDILIEILSFLTLSEKQTCRLVCRYWLKIMTNRMLYNRIELCGSETSIINMMKYFKNHKGLERCVKQLKAKIKSQPEVREFVHLFPKVERLEIQIYHGRKPISRYHEKDYGDDSPTFQNLTELAETNVTHFLAPEPFVTTYLLSRPLRNLTAIFLIWHPLQSDKYGLSEYTRRVLELIGRLKNAPALKELMLRSITLTPAQIELVHQSTPNLEFLLLPSFDLRYLPGPGQQDTESSSAIIQSLISTLPTSSPSNLTMIDIEFNSICSFESGLVGLELFNAWLLYIAHRHRNLTSLAIGRFRYDLLGYSDLIIPNMLVLLSSCPKLTSYKNMMCELSEPMTQEMDKAGIQLSYISFYSVTRTNPKNQLIALAKSAQAQSIKAMQIRLEELILKENIRDHIRHQSSVDNDKIDMDLFASLTCFSVLQTLDISYTRGAPIELIHIAHILKSCQVLETLEVSSISFNPSENEHALFHEYERVSKRREYTGRLKHLVLKKLTRTKDSESVAHLKMSIKAILRLVSPSLRTFTLSVGDAIYKTPRKTVPSSNHILIDFSQHHQLTQISIHYDIGRVVVEDLEKDKDKLLRFHYTQHQGYIEKTLPGEEPKLDFAFNLRLPPQTIVINSSTASA